jgi:hypothetical protein
MPSDAAGTPFPFSNVLMMEVAVRPAAKVLEGNINNGINKPTYNAATIFFKEVLKGIFVPPIRG